MTNESSRQSHRAWMFTINNPLQVDLPDRFVNNSEFMTYQYEQGESGTKHHQGYLVLKANPSNKNGRSLKWLKDNIDKTCHWEPRRGTHQQAVEYCNKEDTRIQGPWTFGEWSDTEGPSRGGQAGGAKNASKILAIKRKIDEGVTEEDLYEEHFGEMLRFGKAFDRYKMVKSGQRRAWHTKAMVLYGKPGTGKSMRARKVSEFIFGDSVYYLQMDAGERVWWDGYTGQRCVVIEEFYGQLKISYLLKLLDRYPMHVETKGSMVPMMAEQIIFTSNEHPRMWYGKGAAPGEPSKIPMDILNALARRFTGKLGAVMEMTELINIEDDEPDFNDVMAEMVAAAEAPSPPPSPVHAEPIDLTCDEELVGEHPDAAHAAGTYPEEDSRSMSPDSIYEMCRSPWPKDLKVHLAGSKHAAHILTERQLDKRFGNQPVQAKLKLVKVEQASNENDDDVDDK